MVLPQMVLTLVPTDTTPPNQRRLAENDVLVELIQKTEYLEDMPMWGQRDYWFYPLGKVTLFIEEEEGAEKELEEEESGWMRDCLKENQSESLGEVLPMEMEGEMEEDSIPGPLWKEIREIGTKRNGQILQGVGEEEETFLFLPVPFKSHNKGPSPLLQQRTQPTPAPSEDRFFMDCSSISSISWPSFFQ